MKHILALLALGLALAVASATPTRSYKGYRLVHATPRHRDDAAALQDLSSWSGVDMWNRRAAPGGNVTLMVAPGATQERVQQRLRSLGLPHTLSDQDVQSMVDREAREQLLARSTANLRDETTPGLRFDSYMRYGEMVSALKAMAKNNPAVHLHDIGKSAEGRTMYVVQITKGTSPEPRKAVLVDAGIHAREWIAPATALYLIDQLVNSPEWTTEATGLDWFFVPMVNPDGYEYTHTTDRFWRKNRGASRDTYWFPWLWNLVCSAGADLNRNFAYHWFESGSSSMPCSETFAGDSAFSEPEARNLRDFIVHLTLHQETVLYLTLHSYGPMILYPWGYSSSAPKPKDAQELVDIANEANEAMVKAGSVPFDVMNSAELYPAAGATDDWAKGVAGIAKSYTMELHGGGSNGFDLPASKILGSVKTTLEGIRVFAKWALNV